MCVYRSPDDIVNCHVSPQIKLRHVLHSTDLRCRESIDPYVSERSWTLGNRVTHTNRRGRTERPPVEELKKRPGELQFSTPPHLDLTRGLCTFGYGKRLLSFFTL